MAFLQGGGVWAVRDALGKGLLLCWERICFDCTPQGNFIPIIALRTSKLISIIIVFMNKATFTLINKTSEMI